MKHDTFCDVELVFGDGFRMCITKERYELTKQLYENNLFPKGSLDRLSDIEFDRTIEAEVNKQQCISSIERAWRDTQQTHGNKGQRT